MTSSTTSAEPRITFANVTKVYRTRRGDVTALDNVSLVVNAGEIVVLLGPSGCGKTTLLRCIAGLEQPDAGDILVGDRPVFSTSRHISLPPEQRHLSMVFQSYALWPHMTVFDNVAYPLQNLKVPTAEARERTEAVLKLVGLEAFANRHPGQLSGGQQQRVALARAIVSNEGVILFDEPLSNLDARVRERLRIELLSLQRDIGFSALYVTHDQAEASALADRIVVMDNGTIAQVGDPAEIYHQPKSRYVAGFVGNANEFDGVVRDADDGTYTVETALGPIVGRSLSRDGMALGDRVVVMFRPEHCTLDTARSVANRLSGRVVRSVFFGSHIDYILAVGDHTVVARGMESIRRLPDGSEMTLGLDAEQAWLFPVS